LLTPSTNNNDGAQKPNLAGTMNIFSGMGNLLKSHQPTTTTTTITLKMTKDESEIGKSVKGVEPLSVQSSESNRK
jgi:hypothetical protein